MRRISVPDSANTETPVSLGGESYSFKFSFNSTNDKYYLDIIYQGVTIISGLKLIPNVYLLKKYALSNFSHGDLIVVNMNNTPDDVGRDNLGIGKPYELFYISNEEFDI